MFKTKSLFKYILVSALTVGVHAQAEPTASDARIGGDPPALASLIKDALASQRTIAEKRLGEAKASDAAREAAGAYLPTIDLEVRYSHLFYGGLDMGDLINPAYAALNQLLGAPAFPTNVSYELPIPLEARVRVAQPLFVPQLYEGAKLAELGQRAAATERRVAEREVVAAVRAAYWGYARAVLLTGLLDDTRAVLEEHQRVSDLLVKTGKATEDVGLRASAELAAHLQRRREVEALGRVGLRALNQLAGRPLEQAIALPEGLIALANEPKPSAPALADSLALAAKARQELALTHIGAEVAMRREALAKQGAWPTLVAALDYGVQSQDVSPDLKDDYLALTVVAKWQIFTGGGTRQRASAARRDLAIARLRDAEQREQIELEVRRATEAIEVATAARQTSQTRIDATARALDLVERRYQAGTAPQIELLAAQAAHLSAQTDHIVALTDMFQALAELDRATGGHLP